MTTEKEGPKRMPCSLYPKADTDVINFASPDATSHKIILLMPCGRPGGGGGNGTCEKVKQCHYRPPSPRKEGT